MVFTCSIIIINIHQVHRVTCAVGVGRQVVELLCQRVNGEETSFGIHETRLGVVKFTRSLLCLVFLASEQVVGAGSGVVRCRQQLAIRRVVERGKHIAQGVGHGPCTAQVVGDVVVCRPIAPVEGYPAACNGKALGGNGVALQSPSQK